MEILSNIFILAILFYYLGYSIKGKKIETLRLFLFFSVITNILVYIAEILK